MTRDEKPDAGQDLPMFVIYKQPRDFPDSYVLRRQVVVGGNIVPDAEPWISAKVTVPDALAIVRRLIPPGLVRIQVPGDDSDPCIWEVWF